MPHARGQTPTEIVLPTDGPVPQRLLEDADVHMLAPTEARWTRPFPGPLDGQSPRSERHAWFHFCHGHHIEFLYWHVTADACGQAVEALRREDPGRARLLLNRIGHLIRGSGALLTFCAGFEPRLYDTCLRASMKSRRDDFSGDMSHEFLAMMGAKADLLDALHASGSDWSDELAAIRAAERRGFDLHVAVIRKLHTGSSLLAEKADLLAQQAADFDLHEYVRTVVHGPEAQHAYDTYFGITRRDDLTIGEYWTQALHKLAVLHREIPLDSSTRAELLCGDGALIALVSERLEGLRATS